MSRVYGLHTLLLDMINVIMCPIKKNEAEIRDVAVELSDLIEKSYDGKSLNVYKGGWKRKIKVIAYRLLEANKDYFDIIPTSGKWKLSTGKAVDDQIKQLAEGSIYEHPQYSTVAELDEVRQHVAPQLPNISDDLKEYLNSYDQNGRLRIDKKWMRESIVRMSELFLENNKLELNDFSEADVLHDIWTFLCRAFKSKETNASLRERASGAVALARNEHRGLGAREKRPRKAIGAKLGIVFKIGYNEHGSCEVGKDDVTVADDKYLDNSLIKLPKTLRDMMALFVQKNIRKINTLLTVGFLVMGLCMELVVMDIPFGEFIARITKTTRFKFLSSIETMAIDFLPLLEITWKGKQAMQISNIAPSLPYSFYHQSAAFM
ncbi:hypothetical protein BDF21DRAFT_439147 [Thamnidium elegans]|nr:hypothetical protein BDF21DRAFT_439147 [Thamnidium elegans]